MNAEKLYLLYVTIDESGIISELIKKEETREVTKYSKEINARVVKITQFGITDVMFSDMMHTDNFNLTDINSTVLDIYI